MQLEGTRALVTSSSFVGVQTFATLAQSSLMMQSSILLELAGANDCFISSISSDVSFADMTVEKIRCTGGIITMMIGSRLSIARTLMRNVESETTLLRINSGEAILTEVTLLYAESAQQLILLAYASNYERGHNY